nr:pyridoxal-phosphate dependent enzyme [Verminephrobacter eiseniae]
MNDLLLPGHAEIEQAAKLVYAAMPATPQYSWPLLNAALGTETWVKHENHTPTGAFKVRGGLVYLQARRASGVISATRGNHGQSVGFAAHRYGIAATIVVPHGNSKEKNAAMRALGVTLVEHGKEFQESREHAVMLAQRDAATIWKWNKGWLARGIAGIGNAIASTVQATMAWLVSSESGMISATAWLANKYPGAACSMYPGMALLRVRHSGAHGGAAIDDGNGNGNASDMAP